MQRPGAAIPPAEILWCLQAQVALGHLLDSLNLLAPRHSVWLMARGHNSTVAGVASRLCSWAGDTMARLCHSPVETAALSDTWVVFWVRSSSSRGPGRASSCLTAVSFPSRVQALAGGMSMKESSAIPESCSNTVCFNYVVKEILQQIMLSELIIYYYFCLFIFTVTRCVIMLLLSCVQPVLYVEKKELEYVSL